MQTISTHQDTDHDQKTLELIKSQIADHNILLYMKGSADFPQCGFSAQVIHILNSLGVEYTTVDVLANPDIRKTLPGYANWPTFPQLYLTGELIGGCDIVTELYQSGELQRMVSD